MLPWMGRTAETQSLSSLVVSLLTATLPLGPFPPTTRIDITTLDPYLHTQSQHHPTADSKREKTTHKKKQPHPTFTFTPTISPRPTTMSTSLDQLKASGTVVVSDSGQSEEKVSSLLCEDANTVGLSRSPSRPHSSLRTVSGCARLCSQPRRCANIRIPAYISTRKSPAE